jgi:hypothetical protein
VIGPVVDQELGPRRAAFDRIEIVVVVEIRIDDLDQRHEIRGQRERLAAERDRKSGSAGLAAIATVRRAKLQ